MQKTWQTQRLAFSLTLDIKRCHKLRWDYFEILLTETADQGSKTLPEWNCQQEKLHFFSLHALFICKFSYHTPSIDSWISNLFYI